MDDTYVLGRFRLVRETGKDDLASVHLASMDGPSGAPSWFTLKRIHPHLVEDASFVQMFLDEARTAARVSHPNIATVYEVAKDEAAYWVVMEHLEGETLRDLIRRDAMPIERACRLVTDAAEGLHAAHELAGRAGEPLGIVHRDISPRRLFITKEGVAKVMDFGIAKFATRFSNQPRGSLGDKLGYMSPEQIRGENVDRRADIFALGVVLWELTTARPLFRQESDLDTLTRLQECSVSLPSALIKGYPSDLERIVMRALAKDPNERFPTAQELARALRACSCGVPAVRLS